MKKILALALALSMALPAMAATDETEQTVSRLSELYQQRVNVGTMLDRLKKYNWELTLMVGQHSAEITDEKQSTLILETQKAQLDKEIEALQKKLKQPTCTLTPYQGNGVLYFDGGNYTW